jgi:hypothetical protein
MGVKAAEALCFFGGVAFFARLSEVMSEPQDSQRRIQEKKRKENECGCHDL